MRLLSINRRKKTSLKESFNKKNLIKNSKKKRNILFEEYYKNSSKELIGILCLVSDFVNVGISEEEVKSYATRKYQVSRFDFNKKIEQPLLQRGFIKMEYNKELDGEAELKISKRGLFFLEYLEIRGLLSAEVRDDSGLKNKSN
jgi:hypothetical protein